MTLTKIKPRRPSTEHRQRHGQHHRHTHHYMKTYWPYLPIAAVLMFGFVANSWFGQFHRSVLGYATDMSISSLLSDTNVQRADNSESPLTLNDELSQAAQAKANDMATRDYWSHNTPDGKTPWTFILAAGYTYQTAGENLAYGFATAADTLTGWMNSPEHRANILNTSYRDVGFGFVDIANYQSSGPETLVVAMYGSLPGELASAAPAPASPQTSVTQHATTTLPAPAPTPPSSPAPAPTPAPPNDTLIATTKPATEISHTPILNKTPIEPPQERISRIQLVAVGNSSLDILLLGLLSIGGFVFLFLRHSLAWRRVIVRGEYFALHHPMLDVLIVTLVTVSFIMSRTAGLIR